MTTAVRVFRVCWTVLVVGVTVAPYVHAGFTSGFLDLSADDLMSHVLNRTLKVAPRAEDVCDVIDVLPFM